MTLILSERCCQIAATYVNGHVCAPQTADLPTTTEEELAAMHDDELGDDADGSVGSADRLQRSRYVHAHGLCWRAEIAHILMSDSKLRLHKHHPLSAELATHLLV